MARDPAIDARLQRWAEWLNSGDGSGYAAVNTLHPNWSPPTPGSRPTMKVHGGSDVRHTHRAIERLSLRLKNAVVVHYVIKGTIEHQAQLLDCEARTVHGRVERAHAALRVEFCN